MVMTLVYLPETLVKKEVGEDITVLAQPPSFRTIFMRQSGRSFGLLKQRFRKKSIAKNKKLADDRTILVSVFIFAGL